MNGDAERRRTEAERRQSYRGERKRPYRPQGENAMRGRYVQVTLLIEPATKRSAQAAARRAGLSFAAWSRELIEDAVRIEAHETGTV